MGRLSNRSIATYATRDLEAPRVVELREDLGTTGASSICG